MKKQEIQWRPRSVGRNVLESISKALDEPVKKTSPEKRLEAYMKLCDFGFESIHHLIHLLLN